jgi:UPF0755 protein
VEMKKKTIRLILNGLLGFVFLGIIIVAAAYYKINSPAFDISKNTFIYIDNKKEYKEVLLQLQTTAPVKNSSLFKKLAARMKYPENIKSGKYEITPRTTYLEAVRMLRSGRQVPVKLTFNNIRLKSDFAERIGNQLLFDSNVLLERLNDPAVTSSLGFDTITILSIFIPNTYEIYWTTPLDQFLERMKKEYDRFWTKERRAKAEAIHLSPVEVSILASIVEEETASKAEFPIVAGLYLNRLKKGMRLQADPTVKFAAGDVLLKRILYAHLQIDSPYNTYKNSGLPPGPIRAPSISALDGVLNYREHFYLYMCAKEDFSGTHHFAVTLSEHNRNAQKYQEALNRNNIH